MTKFSLFGRPIRVSPEPARFRVLLLPAEDGTDISRFRPDVIDHRGYYSLDITNVSSAPVFRFLTLRGDASNGVQLEWTESAELRPFEGIADEASRREALRAIFGDRGDEIDPGLIIALDNAYRYPGDLEAFAKHDASSLVACLSHFVFEVDRTFVDAVPSAGAATVAWKSDASETMGTDEAAQLHWVGGAEVDLEPKLLEIDVLQKAAGFYFVLRDLDGKRPFSEDFDDNDVGERRILVRRSTGPVPAEVMPVFAEILPSEADIKDDDQDPAPKMARFDVHDALGVTDLVGDQIHYRMDVIDAHRRTMATGSVTVLRERLDTPIAPSSVVATMKVRHDVPPTLELLVSVALPDDEDPSKLRIDVLADERELDETGLYGDDDDLSLTEGLRESDLQTDAENADWQPPEGDASDQALERLKGRFEWEGLVPVSAGAGGFPIDALEVVRVEQNGEASDEPDDERAEPEAADDEDVSGRVTYRLELTDGLDAWMKPGRGWRLYAGLSRRTLAMGDRRSRLITAAHQQDIAPPNAEDGIDPLKVFQLERFDLKEPARRFVRGDDLDLQIIDRVTKAPLVPGPDVVDTTKEGRVNVLMTFTHRRIASATLDDEPSDVDAPEAPVAYAGADDFVYGEQPSDDAIQATSKLPVGAYRIWRREPLGLPDHAGSTAGDTEQDTLREGNQQAIIRAARDPDFELETDVLVLPPLVAAYRPIDIGAARPWRVVDRLQGPEDDETWQNTGIPDTPESDRMDRLREALGAAESALLKSDAVALRKSSRNDHVESTEQPDSVDLSDPKQVQEYLSVGLTAGDKPFAESWRVVGRLLSVLREQDLTRDLIVRQSSLNDAWTAISSLVRTKLAADFEHVKVLLTQTFDGAPMATVRLVAIPWKDWEFLPDSGDARRGLDGFLTGPRAMMLRDQHTDPLSLTLQALRRVAWSYEGLEDSWHHDLEWTVEALDRYHQIRKTIRVNLEGETLDDDGSTEGAVSPAPRLEPDSAPEAARRRVEVPRLAPLSDRLSVTPASTERRTTIAFRVSDTVERLNATWNALARSRLGRIQSHLRSHRTLTGLSGYTDGVLRGMQLNWQHHLQAARTALGTAESLEWSAADDTTEWCGLYDVPAAVQSPQKVEVLPFPNTDLIRFESAPYFFTYGMTAWLTADHVVGPVSTAEQERRPGRLGLVRPARVGVTPLPDDRLALQFEVIPPLLASHLSPGEYEEMLRAPVPTLDDYLDPRTETTPPPTDADLMPAGEDPAPHNRALPLHLLPDLEIEIMIYLDIGLRRGKVRSKRILPVIQLYGPDAAAGRGATGDNAPEATGAYGVGWRTLTPGLVSRDAPPEVGLTDGRLFARCQLLRTFENRKVLDELVELDAGGPTDRITIALKRRELVTTRLSCLGLGPQE